MPPGYFFNMFYVKYEKVDAMTKEVDIGMIIIKNKEIGLTERFLLWNKGERSPKISILV